MSNQNNSDNEPSVDEIISDIASGDEKNDGSDEQKESQETEQRKRKDTAGAEGLFGVESTDESQVDSPDAKPEKDSQGTEKAGSNKKQRSDEVNQPKSIGPNEPTAPSPHLQDDAESAPADEGSQKKVQKRANATEKQPEPSADPEASEEATDVTDPPEPDEEGANNPDGAIDSLLSPGDNGEGGIDGDDPLESDPMLSDDGGDDLLADFQDGGMSTTTKGLIGAVAVLFAALGFFVFQYTEVGADLIALFKGELKQKRIAEAQAKEEAFKEKQQEQMTKYGTLQLRGSPKYALIKLNGDVQYGQPSGTNLWTKLRLGANTSFRNLKIGQKHVIQASAPNFESETYDVTEGMWEGEGASPFGYRKQLEIKLPSKSGKRKLEFDQRLKKDPANNYYGEITIKSKPSGAHILFNNHPLRDEDGEKLKTPVTFKKYYVPEDDDSDELEEKKVRVDTPPDRGHKLVLKHPKAELKEDKKDSEKSEDSGDSKKADKDNESSDDKKSGDTKKNQIKKVDIEKLTFATNIERQMWKCNWKEQSEIDRLPDDAPYPKRCNYKFTLNFDFNKLKSYIEERRKRRKEMKEEKQKMEKAIKKHKKKMQGG